MAFIPTRRVNKGGLGSRGDCVVGGWIHGFLQALTRAKHFIWRWARMIDTIACIGTIDALKIKIINIHIYVDVKEGPFIPPNYTKQNMLTYPLRRNFFWDMKLESQWINVVWRLNANSSSNVMYAIYVLINKLVTITSLLLPNSNFQGNITFYRRL